MNSISSVRRRLTVAALLLAFILIGTSFPTDRGANQLGTLLSLNRSVHAGSAYANLSSGSYTFNLNAGNTDQITSNNDWSAIPSVEGYFGQNLTATHGVDPQTVLGSEFASLPSVGNTQINANKGNPSAYNAGGVTEFDSGTYLSFAFQGNVQANPYIIFYINSVGRGPVTFAYDIIDIDGGSNNAVSQVALQYRIGSTGNFTNVPAGYIADATDGPNIDGRVSSRSIQLPLNTANQPNLQVRLITTNAANTSGGSTPDEWIGVNNVVISAFAPTSASVEISGRVLAGKTGVPKAIVSLTDEYGNTTTSLTNSFGYYHFRTVNAGSTVIVGVRSKSYVFDTRVVTVFDDLLDLDIYALE